MHSSQSTPVAQLAHEIHANCTNESRNRSNAFVVHFHIRMGQLTPRVNFDSLHRAASCNNLRICIASLRF